MRHLGQRRGLIQQTTEEKPVTSAATVTDGDFVELASGRVSRTDGSGKLYGVVLGGPNDDLVSRNYRSPDTVGDADGTKKVLVELCEGERYEIPVDGSLASDAEGSYYNILASGRATLTSDATNVTANDTVTIGGITYKFVASPTDPYDVDIGADAATTLDNLKAAINDSGTEGTTYGTGTEQNPYVNATTNTNTTQLLELRSATDSGQSVTVSEASTHLSLDKTTLNGGAGDPYVSNASKSATVGQLLCVKRVATNAAETEFKKGIFVVSAPQSATTPS